MGGHWKEGNWSILCRHGIVTWTQFLENVQRGTKMVDGFGKLSYEVIR